MKTVLVIVIAVLQLTPANHTDTTTKDTQVVTLDVVPYYFASSFRETVAARSKSATETDGVDSNGTRGNAETGTTTKSGYDVGSSSHQTIADDLSLTAAAAFPLHKNASGLLVPHCLLRPVDKRINFKVRHTSSFIRS